MTPIYEMLKMYWQFRSISSQSRMRNDFLIETPMFLSYYTGVSIVPKCAFFYTRFSWRWNFLLQVSKLCYTDHGLSFYSKPADQVPKNQKWLFWSIKDFLRFNQFGFFEGSMTTSAFELLVFGTKFYGKGGDTDFVFLRHHQVLLFVSWSWVKAKTEIWCYNPGKIRFISKKK